MRVLVTLLGRYIILESNDPEELKPKNIFEKLRHWVGATNNSYYIKHKYWMNSSKHSVKEMMNHQQDTNPEDWHEFVTVRDIPHYKDFSYYNCIYHLGIYERNILVMLHRVTEVRLDYQLYLDLEARERDAFWETMSSFCVDYLDNLSCDKIEDAFFEFLDSIKLDCLQETLGCDVDDLDCEDKREFLKFLEELVLEIEIEDATPDQLEHIYKELGNKLDCDIYGKIMENLKCKYLEEIEEEIKEEIKDLEIIPLEDPIIYMVDKKCVGIEGYHDGIQFNLKFERRILPGSVVYFEYINPKGEKHILTHIITESEYNNQLTVQYTLPHYLVTEGNYEIKAFINTVDGRRTDYSNTETFTVDLTPLAIWVNEVGKGKETNGILEIHNLTDGLKIEGSTLNIKDGEEIYFNWNDKKYFPVVNNNKFSFTIPYDQLEKLESEYYGLYYEYGDGCNFVKGNKEIFLSSNPPGYGIYPDKPLIIINKKDFFDENLILTGTILGFAEDDILNIDIKSENFNAIIKADKTYEFEIWRESLDEIKNKSEYIFEIYAYKEIDGVNTKITGYVKLIIDYKYNPWITFDLYQQEVYNGIINPIYINTYIVKDLEFALMVEGYVNDIDANSLVKFSMFDQDYITRSVNNKFIIMIDKDLVNVQPIGTYKAEASFIDKYEFEHSIDKDYKITAKSNIITIKGDLDNDGYIDESEAELLGIQYPANLHITDAAILTHIINSELKMFNRKDSQQLLFSQMYHNTNIEALNVDHNLPHTIPDVLTMYNGIYYAEAKNNQILSYDDRSSDIKYIVRSVSDCELLFLALMEARPCIIIPDDFDVNKFCEVYKGLTDDDWENLSLDEIGEILNLDFSKCIEDELKDKLEPPELPKPDVEDALDEFFPKKHPIMASYDADNEDYDHYDDLKNATEWLIYTEEDYKDVLYLSMQRYANYREGDKNSTKIFFSHVLQDEIQVQLEYTEAVPLFDSNGDPIASTIDYSTIVNVTNSITIPAGVWYWDIPINIIHNSITDNITLKIKVLNVTGDAGYDRVEIVTDEDFTFIEIVDDSNHFAAEITPSYVLEHSTVQHDVYFSKIFPTSITIPFSVVEYTGLEEVHYIHNITFDNPEISYNHITNELTLPANTWEFSFGYPAIDNEDKDYTRHVKVYLNGYQSISMIVDDYDRFNERKDFIHFNEIDFYEQNVKFDGNPNLYYINLLVDKNIANTGDVLNYTLAIKRFDGSSILNKVWKDYEIYVTLQYVGNFSGSIKHGDLPRIVKLTDWETVFSIPISDNPGVRKSYILATISKFEDRNLPISKGEVDLGNGPSGPHLNNLKISANDQQKTLIAIDNLDVPYVPLKLQLSGPQSIERNAFGIFSISSSQAVTEPLEIYFHPDYFDIDPNIVELPDVVTILPGNSSVNFNVIIKNSPEAYLYDNHFKLKLIQPTSNEFDEYLIMNELPIKVINRANNIVVSLYGDVAVYEGDTAEYTVRINKRLARDLSFRVLVNFNQTDNDDFESYPEEVIIEAGELEGVFRLNTKSDGFPEDFETFQVFIHTPDILEYNYSYLNNNMLTTIIDNYATPKIYTTNIIVEEGLTATHIAQLSDMIYVDTEYPIKLYLFKDNIMTDVTHTITFTEGVHFNGSMMRIPEGVNKFEINYTPIDNSAINAEGYIDDDGIEHADTGIKYFLYAGNAKGIAKIIDNKDPKPSDICKIVLSGPDLIYEGSINKYTIKISEKANTEMVFNLDYIMLTASVDDIITYTNQVRIFKGDNEVSFLVEAIDDELIDDREEFQIIISSYYGGNFEYYSDEVMELTVTIADKDLAAYNQGTSIRFPFVGWFGLNDIAPIDGLDGVKAFYPNAEEFIVKDYQLSAYPYRFIRSLIQEQNTNYIEEFRAAIRFDLLYKDHVFRTSSSMIQYLEENHVGEVFGFDLNDYPITYDDIYDIYVVERLIDSCDLTEMLTFNRFDFTKLMYYSAERLINFFKRWKILKCIGKRGSNILKMSPSRTDLLYILNQAGFPVEALPHDELPESDDYRHYITELDQPPELNECLDEDKNPVITKKDFTDPSLVLGELRFYNLHRLLNFITEYSVVEVLGISHPPGFYLMTRFQILQWLYVNGVIDFTYAHESQLPAPKPSANVDPDGDFIPRCQEYSLELKILRDQFRTISESTFNAEYRANKSEYFRNIFFEFQIIRRFGWEGEYELSSISITTMLDMLVELTMISYNDVSNYYTIHLNGSGLCGDSGGDSDDDDICQDTRILPDPLEPGWLNTHYYLPVDVAPHVDGWAAHFREYYKSTDLESLTKENLCMKIRNDRVFDLLDIRLDPCMLGKESLLGILVMYGVYVVEHKMTPEKYIEELIKSDLYRYMDEEIQSMLEFIFTDPTDNNFIINEDTQFRVEYKIIFRAESEDELHGTYVQTYKENEPQFIIDHLDDIEIDNYEFKSYEYDYLGRLAKEWYNKVVNVRFRVRNKKQQYTTLGWGIHSDKSSSKVRIAIGDIKITGV